ncbi:hypothetical protein DE146DRAFT_626758 [Phaeosphaeria sp. MPI-PUGE-AT-0046c]|nr:hypothetical protein DE146DRAFT_626758 [Phaeosphaeria sp. MPI-PUGE-AT-0046c]
MRFQTLSILAVALAVVAAQKVEQDDIPSQCNSVCADLVSTAQRCDNQNDDDNAELQCICSSQNANTLVPDCELCVRTNNRNDDRVDDNDVYDVLTSCSFTRAQQTPSGTVIQTTISSSGTIMQTSVMVTPTGGAAPRQTGAAIGLGALGLALGML